VGGVFLNKTLLTLASRMLRRKGFEVLRPRQYSPNDESISLGQVAYALARLKSRR
jgi:hydrogenase maturation protein HypF